MHEANSLLTKFHRKLLKRQDFCIVSNDCWGAEVYHYFDRAYNTPFIGLFLMAPCYIDMIENLEVIYSDLKFVSESKYQLQNEKRQKENNFYPIGVLENGSEIHFLHYPSDEDAKTKWNRRLQRMNFDNLFFKFDGAKDYATDSHIKRFSQLQYESKLCLTKVEYPDNNTVIYCGDWESDGAKMFKKSIKNYSIVKWLNDKRLKPLSIIERVLLQF